MSKKDLPNLKDVSRIPEELLPVVEWWQTKGPKTVGIIAVAVAIAAAGTFWWESAKAKDDAVVVAHMALPAETRTVAEGEIARDEQLTQLIDQGTDNAPAMLLERAHGRYNAAEYDAALADYDEALKTISDPALTDIAAVGRVMTLEALGRTDDALTAVADLEAAFAQATQPHYLASEVTFAKARLLTVKGDKDAAKLALAALIASTDEVVKAKAEATLAMIEAYGVTPPPAPAPVATPAPEAAPVPEATPAPEVPAEVPAPEATPAPETPAKVPAPVQQ